MHAHRKSDAHSAERVEVVECGLQELGSEELPDVRKYGRPADEELYAEKARKQAGCQKKINAEEKKADSESQATEEKRRGSPQAFGFSDSPPRPEDQFSPAGARDDPGSSWETPLVHEMRSMDAEASILREPQG